MKDKVSGELKPVTVITPPVSDSTSATCADIKESDPADQYPVTFNNSGYNIQELN